MGQIWDRYETDMGHIWDTYGADMGRIWDTYVILYVFFMAKERVPTVDSFAVNFSLFLLFLKISKCKKEKEKEKLRKQKKNLLRKYNDLKSDTHHKLGTFLAKKYSVIVLPKFGSKEMVSKRVGRKLKTKTCRLMLSMAHGEFREKLLYKARDQDSKVIVGNESYTTKTCGNCGIINEKVGGSKVFHCTHCGLRAHRDVHAARNILLKHLCVHR